MKKVLFLLFLFSNTILLAQNWQTSFEEAKSKAIKENKNIVLVFSGSDWFAPCMKFEKNVFNSNVFQTEAEKNWVIYKADFPEKKANQLNPELTEQNKKLAEKYNQNGSFPLVLLLDKNGKASGMTGFKNVSAEEYVNLIKSFQK
jgi:thioredoxin-related protein